MSLTKKSLVNCIKACLKSTTSRKVTRKSVRKAAPKASRKVTRKSVRKAAPKASRKVTRKSVRKAAPKASRKVTRKSVRKAAPKTSRKISRKTSRKVVRKSVRKADPKTSRKVIRKSITKSAYKMGGCGYKMGGCGYKMGGCGYKMDGCGYKMNNESELKKYLNKDPRERGVMNRIIELVRLGADPNLVYVSENGIPTSPLFHAMRADDSVSLVQLLRLGADPNMRIKNTAVNRTYTPLILQGFKAEPSRQMIDILIDYGGDLEAVDDDGNTALELIDQKDYRIGEYIKFRKRVMENSNN